MSEDLIAKYGLQTAAAGDAMGLASEVIHGAVATVADFGTSVWNSLPMTPEVSTSDLLSKIDENALSVYNEHPDLIHAASFIGGTFVPIGISTKLMSMARDGSKAVNWFSKAGEIDRMKKVETAFTEAGVGSDAYKAATYSVYRAMAGNAMADSLAAELAITATMNAHPYMEDYNKDFKSNFVFWTAVGGGIGAGVGAIIQRTAIKGLTHGIESNAVKEVLDRGGIPRPDSVVSYADQIPIRLKYADYLDAKVAKSADPNFPDYKLNPLTISLLKATSERERALAASIATDNLMTGELAKAPADIIKIQTDRLANNASFSGTDKMGWFKGNDSVVNPVAKGGLTNEPTLVSTITKKSGVVEDYYPKAVFLPDHNAFIGEGDAALFTNLTAVVDSVEEVAARGDHINPSFVNHDQFLGLSAAPTHEADLIYAATFDRVSRLGFDELKGMTVSAADLPMQKAVATRLKSLSTEEAAQVNIKLTSNPPSYDAQVAYAIAKKGLPSNYAKELEVLSKDFEAKFSVYTPGAAAHIGVSDSLHAELSSWVQGHTSTFREAVLDMRAGKSSPAASALKEFKQHPKSVELRNTFALRADAEGYIYLYRGLKRNPTGHATVESYTLTTGKAAQFSRGVAGNVRLYKVHVDDILGGFIDIGPGSHNAEILVLSPTRESALVDISKPHEVPMDLVADVETGLSFVPASGEKALNAAEFIKAADDSTISTIQGYLKQGMAAETVALRTGATLAAVKEIQLGIAQTASLTKYTTADSIKEALNPANKAIVIQANPRKVVNERILKANLNAQTMDNASAELINYYMSSSSSTLVQDIHSFYGTEDAKTLTKWLYNSIGEVTSAGLGTVFFNSLNAALASFKDAGVIATKLGHSNTTIRNRMIEKFITPLTEIGGRILKSQAATYEHNLAANFESSLAGWHIFDPKTGQFLVKEKQEVNKIVNGKNVTSMVEVLVPAESNGKTFTITNPDVILMFTKYQEAGREMYALRNLPNEVMGNKSLTDRGFWKPAINPRDKQKAYVFDSRTQSVSIIYAKTVGELTDAVLSYERKIEAEGLKGKVRVVTNGKEQEFFNKLAGRHDDMYMAIADVSLRHTGSSAAAVVKTNSEPLSEIINGFDHYLGKGIDTVIELNMAPVMDALKFISDSSQRGYSSGALGTIQKMRQKPVDPGQVMRNAILGKPNLGEYEAWRTWQQSWQVGTDYALNFVSTILAPIFQPVKGKLFGKETIRDADTFKALNNELIANNLVPLQGVDDFARYLKEGSVATENITPRVIALSNGLAATMLLRFFDAAQAFVNMVSLPVLTSGAIRRNLSNSFMDGVLNPNAKFGLAESMFTGVRLMNHKVQGQKWSKYASDLNLFRPVVSEANDIMHHVRSVEGGLTSKMESLLESKFFEVSIGNGKKVSLATGVADYTESMVRETAYFTGVGIALKAYPGLSDLGVVTFARNFMDEAVGNYSAAQRPVFFQGTFGVAMGLFQTYMLTFAQNTYRQIGTKDWKGLSRTMFAQAGIFGTSSLPGFHMVSEAIGDSFSDDHFDLETGTFRAIGNEAGNIALYGLLSSFGPGIVTRGDIQPRIPTPLTMDTIATVNLAKQSYQAADKLVAAAFTADADTGRAMLEALSLQSVSRPIARLSELATGTAITGAGKVVANNAEIYTTQGILSRLMATRPLEEIKTRNALQRNSVYGAVDSDRRKAVTKALKTYIRGGDLDSQKIQELQYEYMRFGSAQGWRGAVADAMLESTRPGAKSVKDRLSPDAPWQLMIDDSGL